MEVVVRTEAGEAELDVGWQDAGPEPRPPALGDLVARVTGRRPPPTICVDGRLWRDSTPLARVGLRRGSVIATGPRAHPGDDERAALTRVVVVAGQGVGHQRGLLPGRYRIGPGIGRRELGDGLVRDSMIEIVAPVERVELADLDDRVLVVGPAPPPGPGGGSLGPPGADGTTAFNRPPRPAAEPEPPPITVPEGSRPIADARRFPLLALVAPLPVAVALAAALGHWRFLLVGLMSPVLLAANWLEERRSRSAERRRADAADAAAAAELRAALEDRHRADLGRARRSHPTLAEALEWVHDAAPALWSRRADHPDAFAIPIGIGPRPWSPPLVQVARALGPVDRLATGLGSLPAVPMTVDLGLGRSVGLVGPPDATAAVARGLLMALAALHGPADVRVVVAVDAVGAPAWEWVKWLPHAHRRRGAAVVTHHAALLAVAGPLGRASPAVVVAVGAPWWHDHDAPLRPLLATGAVRLVALCERESLVPAACSTVVHVPALGRGRIDELATRRSLTGVALNRLDLGRATAGARALARLHDPEDTDDDAADDSLATAVDLADLLGLPAVGAAPAALATNTAAIAERWEHPARRPRVPIGSAPAGPVVVDLIEHGPHGLIAGTTGAGKSELLRTLVVALATTLPPEELNVVLVDFKGGAAFDACADLPHVVGLVTDLDDHLAARVLRCLGAEVTHRERVLRAAGISSLDDAPDGACRGLSRLVLVVDEFALLAGQLPDFVPGLVDIAQRGRSLGIHLVLATQRPAGVVDAKIRANTNLRIALRVQDDADSLDVIGTRAAALIPRHAPGRAVARFGVDELVTFQAARAAGDAARPAGDDAPLTVRPFVTARALSSLERRVLGAARHPAGPAPPPGEAALRRLVGAVAEAARGRTPPRRPYVEPLPERVDATMVHEGASPPSGAGVVLGLEDRPGEQRQDWWRWRPGRDGCLALYGMVGAGTSSALVTLALGLAREYGPDDVHLYAIDADAGRLGAIAALPHTGAVVGSGDPARLVRLARLLDREQERRRHAGARRSAGDGGEIPPAIVLLLVDNVGSLRQTLDATPGAAPVWAVFERLLRDGPGLGIVAAVTATAERDLPPSASAHIAERVVLRQPAGSAYASFGLRPTEVPRMVPGRALRPAVGTEVQLLAPPSDLAAAFEASARAAGPARRRPPARVDPLPPQVDVADLLDRAAMTRDGWRIPVGVALQDASALDVELRPGAPFVIVGPPGSGRTTVLGAMASSVRAVDPGVTVYCLGPRSAPVDPQAIAPAGPGDVPGWVEAVVDDRRRRLLLVDDADAMDGPSLERLATLHALDLVVVLAGRPDGLRRVGHWSRPWLRRGRGIVLSPDPADGDVLGVALPARLGRCPRGQGLLVDDGSVVPLLCASRPRAST